MAVIKPIPRSLLIHSVLLQKVKKDQWGKMEVTGENKINFVRIEPSSKVVKDKNNNEVQLAAVLFFDCRKSRPKNTAFGEGDVVVFNQLKYKIQLIESLYDEKKLHHYEIGMVKQA